MLYALSFMSSVISMVDAYSHGYEAISTNTDSIIAAMFLCAAVLNDRST